MDYRWKNIVLIWLWIENKLFHAMLCDIRFISMCGVNYLGERSNWLVYLDWPWVGHALHPAPVSECLLSSGTLLPWEHHRHAGNGSAATRPLLLCASLLATGSSWTYCRHNWGWWHLWERRRERESLGNTKKERVLGSDSSSVADHKP